MRRAFSLFLAIIMVFTLCSCGKEETEELERECGVYITVEASDIYAVSCGTENGSETCQHADGTPISIGEVIHFDFAGDGANTASCPMNYSIGIMDKALESLAVKPFSDDFGNLARIDITVTADHHIAYSGSSASCGGDVTVSFPTTRPTRELPSKTAP